MYNLVIRFSDKVMLIDSKTFGDGPREYSRLHGRVKTLKQHLGLNIRKVGAMIIWRPRVAGKWLTYPHIELIKQSRIINTLKH